MIKPFVADPDFDLYVGDVRDVLADLPDESVHCVVTSPPYWGLRDYGTAEWEGGDPACDHVVPRHAQAKDVGLNARMGRSEGDRKQETAKRVQYRGACERCGAVRIDRQIGLESSPDEFVEALVDVFRQVRRVLRRDGTLWLNLGDSYTSGDRDYRDPGRSEINGGARVAGLTDRGTRPPTPSGLKEKDLVGIPWRVAFALQADGWYLRSDVIWSKPNPMPESTTDRPTKAHEYVFLLTREPRYFYDYVAIREPFQTVPQRRLTSTAEQPKGPARAEAGVQNPTCQGTGGLIAPPQVETLDGMEGEAPRGPDGRRKIVHDHQTEASHPNYDNIGNGHERWPNGGRNKRTVWHIATRSYEEAHFAVFPEQLVEPCVKAGTSERGCCPECGSPWKRIVETNSPSKWAADDDDRGWANTHQTTGNAQSSKSLHRQRGGVYPTAVDLGWAATCKHGLDPVPCRVLDPFMGSGTTALVARRLGRHAVGVELNPEYARLIADRLRQLSLFA